MGSATGWVAITDVAKVVNPGQGLLIWANKQGLAGKTLGESSGLGGGRRVHRFMERLAAGESPTFMLDLPVEQPLRAYVDALVGCWQAKAWTILHCEQNVAREDELVRGRIDLAVACDAPDCYCMGEGARVKDFKSGGHRLYPEAHLQGDGYRFVWPYSGLAPRHLCGVDFITLGADARWKEHPLVAPDGYFETALKLWRLHTETRDLLKV